ncbi:hypothetical protein R6Q59_004154 [Mikania micrantha]
MHHEKQVFYTSYPAVKRDTKDLWAVVKTKSRHIYEITGPESDGTEEHGFLQFDERFKLPHEVTSSERMCLVTDIIATEEMADEDDMQFEEEEFDFNENTSNDDNDDDDEMDFSDHSSDEDEFDC